MSIMQPKAIVCSHGRSAVLRDASHREAQRLERRLLTGRLGDEDDGALEEFRAAHGATEHELVLPVRPSAHDAGRRKTTLLDAARTYLEEHSDSADGVFSGSTVDAMGLEEQSFIRMCMDVNERVMTTHALFDDLDRKVKQRVRDLDARRQLRGARTTSEEEEEHFSFAEYHAWLRTRGKVDEEEVGEIGEGNLLPILAVLEGECDALQRLPVKTRSGRHLRNIGGLLVDESELLGDTDEYGGEDFPTLLTHSRGIQSDPEDADETQKAMALLRSEIAQLREQLVAREWRVAQLELFRDSATRRIVALRENVARLHMRQGEETRKLSAMAAEAMAQNERLVKKLEAWANNERLGSEKKEKAERLFTRQLVRLRLRNSIVALRIERAENSMMQMQDDYHFQAHKCGEALARAHAGRIERRVRDQVEALKSVMEEQASEVGGSTLASVRTEAEELLPVDLVPRVMGAAEALFRSIDFNCLLGARSGLKLVGCGESRDMVEALQGLDVLGAAREAVASALSDISTAVSDFAAKESARTDRARHLLQERHSKEVEECERRMREALDQQAQEQAQQRRRASSKQVKALVSVSVGTHEHDPAEQGGGDRACMALPPPRMAPVMIPAELPTHHPQDIVLLAQGLIVDCVVEASLVAAVTMQPLPTRVEALSEVLRLLATLTPLVTTGVGLSDVAPLAEEEAAAAAENTERAAQQWWAAGESVDSKGVSLQRAIKNSAWRNLGLERAAAIAGDALAPRELTRYRKLLTLVRDPNRAAELLAPRESKSNAVRGAGGVTKKKKKQKRAAGDSSSNSSVAACAAPLSKMGMGSGTGGASELDSQAHRCEPAAMPSTRSPLPSPSRRGADDAEPCPGFHTPPNSLTAHASEGLPVQRASNPTSGDAAAFVMLRTEGPNTTHTHVAAVATQTAPSDLAHYQGSATDMKGMEGEGPVPQRSRERVNLVTLRGRTRGKAVSLEVGGKAKANERPTDAGDAHSGYRATLLPGLEALRRATWEHCRAEVPAFDDDNDAGDGGGAKPSCAESDAAVVRELVACLVRELRRRGAQQQRRQTLPTPINPHDDNDDDDEALLAPSSTVSVGAFHHRRSRSVASLSLRGSHRRNSGHAAPTALPTRGPIAVSQTAEKGVMCCLLRGGGGDGNGDGSLSAEGQQITLAADFAALRKAAAAAAAAKRPPRQRDGPQSFKQRPDAGRITEDDAGEATLADSEQHRASRSQEGATFDGTSPETAGCATAAASTPLLALRRLLPSRGNERGAARPRRHGGAPEHSLLPLSPPLAISPPLLPPVCGKIIREVYL